MFTVCVHVDGDKVPRKVYCVCTCRWRQGSLLGLLYMFM